jgi:predicted membrane-bound spermidine synthase
MQKIFNHTQLKIYFVIFTLSGFSGLIYESIWTHYLKLFLGHAAYAQTLVLAIFMGGMAVGSWICSRYSGRWDNLLLGYALTEGIIGICALVFHPVFATTVEYAYSTLIPALGSPASVSVFKWSLATLMILPQSILLGMTFPLMSSGILRRFPDRPGRSIALLYFCNSIGAAVGVLASGFLLIRLTGLPGTIGIAGSINIFLSVFVWRLVKGNAPRVRPLAEVDGHARRFPGKGWYLWFLLVSLVTGTASFIYEIGWIRMLSLVLGTSTHAFELMLSAFILGLALGGLWIQRKIDHVSSPTRYLAVVQVAMGMLALSTLLLYGNTFEVMRWIIKTLPKTEAGYALFNISSSAIAMGVMLPATFCAGMTLPLITYLLIKEGHGERSIGAVYGANTIGAIIGVFLAVHLGMPLLGLKGLITFGATLDILLGLALLWSSTRGSGECRMPLFATGAAFMAVAGTLLFVHLDPYKMASGVYRFGTILEKGKIDLLYYRDGKTASVSLVRADDGSVGINTNGKTDASIMMVPGRPSTSDESTMILTAALPMAMNPDAMSAATIGLGSGLTSQTLLTNPNLKVVDTVEIEQRMVDGAKNFRPNVELVYTDPRSRIYIDDAKTFFSTYNRKYDLIVSEPSNPWVSGVAGLFSDEFYRLIKRHLNERGIFVQWVQLYEIDTDLVISVLKAIRTNFSDYVVYAPNDFDMIIIAKGKGKLSAPDRNILGIPAIETALKRIYINGPQDIEIRKIGDRRFLDRMLQEYPCKTNSDYFPYIDQNAARTRFMGSSAAELTIFPQVPLPALEMLSPPGSPRTETNVTPSIYSHNSQSAYTAMVLRDYFLTGNYRDSYGAIPDNVRQDAMKVKGMFTSRADSRMMMEGVGNFFATAIRIIPFLTPNELDSIWNSMVKGPCYSAAPVQIKELLSLFRSAGERNGRDIYLKSKELLVGSAEMTQGTVKFLLSSGMLGAITDGDWKASGALWNSYGNAACANGQQPDLLLRLLISESHGK